MLIFMEDFHRNINLPRKQNNERMKKETEKRKGKSSVKKAKFK